MLKFICILIDEHRNRNEKYYNIGRNQEVFWESIAIRINREHNTGQYLISKFTFSYYLDDEKPEDLFNRINNMNVSNHR
ncbi:976_t:CDS:2 [Funneliformis geosporum]|nr:976_t:CDS:2 [Funneliformis geosporum]